MLVKSLHSNVFNIPVMYGGQYYSRPGQDLDMNDDFLQFSARRKNARKSGLDMIQSRRQVGLAMISIGMMLSLLGTMLFFEKNLLRLGNVLLLGGSTCLVGPGRVVQFFSNPKRFQSTVIFFLGIFLVVIGRVRLGLICEVLGFLNLFGKVLPLVFALLKTLPVVGDVLRNVESAARQPMAQMRGGPSSLNNWGKDYGFYSPQF